VAGAAIVVLAAVLAVARRGRPDRLVPLAVVVAVLSIAHSAAAVAARHTGVSLPVGFSLTELAAVGLTVGAVTRSARPGPAIAYAVLGAAALSAAPLARAGTGVDVHLFAVPAALIWGVALAFGLVLRDGDRRRLDTRDEARRAERMRIARELHDVVTHHVTGIAVQAQAARMVTARSPSGVDHEQSYREIERSAAASLTAMRGMVGMLRAAGDRPAPAPAGIEAVLAGATRDDPRVRVELAGGAAMPDPGPDISATLHWLVLESLTNVRRHATEATRITIRVGTEKRPSALVLEVANDGVTAPGNEVGAAARYGLAGMRERVAALGGTLHAAPEAGRCWRVTARIPLNGQRR
jgi:signal transduction histidine kinase